MNEYIYDDIKIGMKESFDVVIEENMLDDFRSITKDVNPMHKDDEFAKSISNNKYKNHIAFGMLTASFLSTLAGVYMPGKYSLIHSIENIKFKGEVYVGDKLNIEGEVVEKIDALKLIMLKVSVLNQNKKTVLDAKMKIIVMR